ncbi:methyl-accepting chemotaxis protein [Pseudoduganella buxea]|uniref:Methyl-accepting chemotaxis protein n=1 Tax=Pseudoduganella buxea TaxID=1949069 RepID=A0ABQ1KB97_9BURK|nr:methyl-accepting chemotaxis protein [Pseudoduganella buxea]GGB93537.1 methyl-accepting chemotaxis protein [Pseudoduganella buxea]
MTAFRHISIATKLYTAFALALLFTIVLAVTAISQVRFIDGALENADLLRRTQLEPLYEAREALDQTGIAARNAYIFTDLAAARRELELVDQHKALYLAKLDELDVPLRENPAWQKVRSGLVQMAAALERPRKYREANEMEGFGTFLVEECSPLRRQIVADIGVLLHDLQQRTSDASKATGAQAARAQYWIGALSILSALVCAVTGTAIVRGLLKQLGGEPSYAASVARGIARGELHRPVDTARAAPSSLLQAMSTMRDGLAGIVTQVRGGTDAIASASAEIASGNLDLSARTENQAQSLAKIATLMKQLIASVRRNADYAAEARQVAASASAVSQRGGAAVEGIVTTMNLINESSRRIVDIIGVIDGIAFQTNILALNAAVEAARAGEQGRGFAVVATEVRNLAHRSAAAAKEVKALIEDSVSKVGIGTDQVSQAGATMRDVVEGIGRVTQIMTEISNATRTQTDDIEYVDNAIVELDDTTCQNAALVEQAASAAEALRTQAAELAGVVHTFQLEA